MKCTAFMVLVVGLAVSSVSYSSSDAEKNGKIGKEAMDYVISSNKKANRNPQEDIKKITSICGTPVSSKCYWKDKGTNKWEFQKKGDNGKGEGKIYDVPGFLMR